MGIRQTPRSLPAMGMMADGVQAASDATGWLGEGMGLPHVARTLDRLSYGEPLTTGQGMTTRPRPDTMGAVGAVLPFVPPSKLSPLVSGGMSMVLQPATLDGVIQSLLEKYMKQ